LKKNQEAKAALEAEAKAKAEAKAAEAKAKLEERARQEQETGKKTSGRRPEVPVVEEAKPDPKAQRNFTDPESRIMPDGANKGSFVQGYNAQIAVDAEWPDHRRCGSDAAGERQAAAGADDEGGLSRWSVGWRM